MIKELINFTDSLDEDVFTWNKKPSDGLHLFLNMNTDRSFQDLSFTYYSDKKNTGNDFPQLQKNKITGYESAGRRIGTNMNKAFHKKLFACNPFIISFKKKNFSDLTEDNFADFLNTAHDVAKLSNHEKEIGELFVKEVNRLTKEVIQTLSQTNIVIDKKKGNYEKEENLLSLLGKDDYINFYLESFPDENGKVCPTDFKKYHDRYLNQKVFNKDEEDYKIGEIENGGKKKYVFFNELFEKKKDGNGKLVTRKGKQIYINEFISGLKQYEHKRSYGISDYLNGLNSNKPYFEHKTAMFQNGISQYIDGDMARALYKFEQLINVNRILPNPLPIIIWNDNLLKEGEVGIEEDVFLKEYKENIAIIKDKEIRLGFSEVLRNLFERNNSFRLSNFYLFNFAGGKLRDFDFVEEFKYKIDNLSIKIIFRDGVEGVNKKDINNIFDFERQIVHTIFDNSLVTEYNLEETNSKEKIKHKGVLFKYFDDLKDSNYKGSMFLLVTKYRKAFYDYI